MASVPAAQAPTGGRPRLFLGATEPNGPQVAASMCMLSFSIRWPLVRKITLTNCSHFSLHGPHTIPSRSAQPADGDSRKGAPRRLPLPCWDLGGRRRCCRGHAPQRE